MRIQKRLLYDLLKYVQINIPYYRRVFQELHLEFYQGDVHETLSKLPVLTKDIVRSEFTNLYKLTDNIRWHYNTSGGSTGEPVKLIQDDLFAMKKRLVKRLQNEWAGHQIGDTLIKLWGSERDIFKEKEALRHRLGRWINSTYLLNSFMMDEESMREYVTFINRMRPKLILAYAQSINELAKYILKNNLEVYSPSSIMTSAGVLYPTFRNTIQNVFRCPVFNCYGSREVGNVACECEMHQGLHVSSFTHCVEILNEDLQPCEEGELGEIYVTLLTNFTMPLIRYKIGDMAVYTNQQCPCGRGLPLIKALVGRNVDIFITSKNHLVDGEYFSHLFYFKHYVSQFQVIQKSPLLLKVRIKLTSNEDVDLFRKDVKKITGQIQLVMGRECAVNFEIVDQIETTHSGKYRYTVRDF